MRRTFHEQDHQTVAALREIIEPLLMEIQENRCAMCGEEGLDLDIDHKRYGADVTIYDLQLICRDCHCEKHPNVPVLRGAGKASK